MTREKVSDFEHRISELLDSLSGNDTEKGKLLGVSRQTISAWRTGVRSPKSPVISHIASVCNVSLEWLLGFDVPMTPSSQDRFSHPDILPIRTRSRVPILGGAACGEPIYAPGDGTEYIDVEDDLPCDFALIAEGDSMIGDRIMDGDVVFFHAQPDVEDGQIAAVELDGGMMIKRVKRLRAPDGSVLFTQLLSSNAKYTSIDIGGPDETRTAHILGKAVAFKALLNQ